jgi:hypothetical protein
VIVIGLLACVAAALLTTGKGEGAAAQLEWVQKAPLPDSKPAQVPGSNDRLRLAEAGIRATGTNISGYELFRAGGVLRVDAGAPIGGGRIRCAVKGPPGAEVAQTPGSRASYPRSSEELIKQEVPENVLVEFTSHGTDLAVVEFGDAFKSFTDDPGTKVEWPSFHVGHEQWEWFLPSGPLSKPLELGFASIWRTTVIPAAHLSCTLKTSAGTATVSTAGALSKKSEPIAE